MNMSLKIVVLSLVCAFLFQFSGFCEYYELVDKWIKLNGPKDFEVIGIGLDEPACEMLKSASGYGDKSLFARTLRDYNIFRVINGSSAMVLTVDFDQKRAKVMVFKSLYERESGWVPIEWLDGNEYRPRIKDVVKDNYTSKNLRSFYQ